MFLALGFLIIVHEGGHYFVARWCGMRVERFSIGFGPGIFKRTAKSGTVFQIAPILFGGFVEIKGMNIAEDVDPNDRQAYPNRPAWQRFITILAGPATNYLSAIVLAFGLFTCHGMDAPRTHSLVMGTKAEFDAVGKILPNDEILAVDGSPLVIGQGLTLSQRVQEKKGAPVVLTVLRNGAKQDISVVPKLGKLDEKDDKQVYMLGLQLSATQVVDVGVGTAAKEAVIYPVRKTKEIAVGLYSLIDHPDQADLGGPVRILGEFQKAFEEGFVWGIRLLMLLSVYLGLFNLFPLPALDGGRLVFLGYELVTRRRANPKIEAMVHMGGIMVLFVVMIIATYNDVTKYIKQAFF
jgi:regulator of sigma E protease